MSQQSLQVKRDGEIHMEIIRRITDALYDTNLSKGFCNLHKEACQELWPDEFLCESCYEMSQNICPCCHNTKPLVIEEGHAYCRECMEEYKNSFEVERE